MGFAICIGLLQSHPDVFLPPTLPMERKIELYSNKVVTPNGVIPALVTVYHGRIQSIERMEKKTNATNERTRQEDDEKDEQNSRVIRQRDDFLRFHG